MNKPTTTLARIRAHGPCDRGYKTLCKGLGGVRKYGKDTPITVRQIVEINGLDDALWCLRTMPEHDRRWRILAVRYARRVQHLMRDQRGLDALDVAERYANGLATDDELHAAEIAAEKAAWAARKAEWTTAESERIADRATVEVALADAGAAALSSARSAVWCTSWYAAEAVTWAAAETLETFTWGAAEIAVWEAERKWQAEELIRISEEDL